MHLARWDAAHTDGSGAGDGKDQGKGEDEQQVQGPVANARHSPIRTQHLIQTTVFATWGRRKNEAVSLHTGRRYALTGLGSMWSSCPGSRRLPGATGVERPLPDAQEGSQETARRRETKVK